MSLKDQETPRYCERCAREERETLADYRLTPEEVTLQGPSLGDPDFWPQPSPPALCEEHYRLLPADARLDYVLQDAGPYWPG